MSGRRRRRRACGNGHRFTTYELAAAELAEIEQSVVALREWQTQIRALLEAAP